MKTINNIKTYDKYKDSGIEWIGEIPFDWNIRKIKYCCNLYTGNSISDDEKDNYILNENSIPYIATKDIDADTNSINYDNGLYIPLNNKDFKIAPSNSSLLCIEGGSAGKKIGFTDKDVCFVNKLCCFSSKENFNSKFLYYILQSDEFLTDFNLKMTGLIGGVSQIAIKNISIATPKIEEQNRITNYLDKKCGEVDRVVEVQKLIIEKLKEYKQSVITEAVTKGLDKNAPLKDSSIEWIGKIPQDWEIGRIKYNYYLKGRIGWQGLKASEFLDEGAYLITGTDFLNGRVNWETCYHISEERYNEAPEIHVKRDDLLITKDGTVGKIAYIDNKPEKVSLNSHLLIIRPNNKNYKNRFLYWVIQSEIFEKYYQLSQNGTIMASLSQEKISNFSFALPEKDTQIKVSEYLDKKCSEIDKAISEKEVLIEKLTQYKKSLIYECVTGKRRVSERHCEECK